MDGPVTLSDRPRTIETLLPVVFFNPFALHKAREHTRDTLAVFAQTYACPWARCKSPSHELVMSTRLVFNCQDEQLVINGMRLSRMTGHCHNSVQCHLGGECCLLDFLLRYRSVSLKSLNLFKITLV